MAVVIVMSIGASAQEFILSEVKTIGTDLIGSSYQVKSDKNVPPSGVMGIVNTSLKYEDGEDILKRIIKILIVLLCMYKEIVILFLKTIQQMLPFTGSTESYLVVEKAKIASGRFFTKEEEKNFSRVAVLGSNLAKDYLGIRILLIKRVKIKKLNFKVIGVFEEKGSCSRSR